MLTLNISEADIELLRYERYTYPCMLVQKRMTAILIKATTTYSHQEIAQLADISPNSVTNYIHLWNESGYEGILKVGYGTNQSELKQSIG